MSHSATSSATSGEIGRGLGQDETNMNDSSLALSEATPASLNVGLLPAAISSKSGPASHNYGMEAGNTVLHHTTPHHNTTHHILETDNTVQAALLSPHYTEY